MIKNGQQISFAVHWNWLVCICVTCTLHGTFANVRTRGQNILSCTRTLTTVSISGKQMELGCSVVTSFQLLMKQCFPMHLKSFKLTISFFPVAFTTERVHVRFALHCSKQPLLWAITLSSWNIYSDEQLLSTFIS